MGGLILFEINKTVEHTTAEFQIFWADPLGSPAFKCCLTDTPAGGEVSLVEMNDFLAGLRTGWWESMKNPHCREALRVFSGADLRWRLSAAFAARIVRLDNVLVEVQGLARDAGPAELLLDAFACAATHRGTQIRVVD